MAKFPLSISSFLFLLFSHAFVSTPSTSDLILLDNDSVNRFVNLVVEVCKGNDVQGSCQTRLTELTMMASSLSERRRLELLNTFLKHSVWRMEIVVSVLKDVRLGSLGVREYADLVDCEQMMDWAKEGILSSTEELKGANPILESSFVNVHTWLSGVLTSYTTCFDWISNGITKGRVESELEDLISRARVALAIVVSITPAADLKMVVPSTDGFPSWLTNLDSTEVLKSKANLVVAKDGTGDYKTVVEAVAAAPMNSKIQFIIHVKKGVYSEIVQIGSTKTNITIVGDGGEATVLTGSLNYQDGVKTFDSATLAVDGLGFMAQDIVIENTAGPAKGQAVAVRVSADLSVFHRCRIDGYQDTLYAHRNRQFYRDCIITGTIDFICGDAAAVFQYCRIVAKKPLPGQANVITAQSREYANLNSGFSLQKCNITGSPDLAPVKATVKTYLGRPWKPYSRVVVLQSFIDDHIDPAGWAPWKGEIGLSTLFYGEYENKGPGANTNNRVSWKGFKVITDTKEAANYTVAIILHDEMWLKSTGVPFENGL
ncbi:Pectinesterase/pectinesterase inhibitor 18 [Cardamine amara subsp. amara]|uniref:Pectinesterase/pectinesterase inhibitor 18 n=1 Tax=Cardamine amara subsp. amara TaxID=228776 RepID=A0ABD1AE98_CARAN